MQNNLTILRRELINILNTINSEYNKQKINITNEEWDLFLFVLESHFLANNIMNNYVDALNNIIRRAIYFSIIDISDECNMNYIIKALDILNKYNIENDEIMALQEEIDERIKIKQK